jgi:type II secretory pathway pseudopilin PulG
MRAQAGFAYLWAMLAVFLLGIYLAKVGTMWSTQARRERETELLHRGMAIMNAIQAYVQANHRYPKNLGELVKDPHAPTLRRFLRRAYADPMTGGDWALIYRENDKSLCGVYSTAPGEPLKQDGFVQALAMFTDKKSYADWQFVVGGVVKHATEQTLSCGG